MYLRILEGLPVDMNSGTPVFSTPAGQPPDLPGRTPFYRQTDVRW
jgi:hypothetical protein